MVQSPSSSCSSVPRGLNVEVRVVEALVAQAEDVRLVAPADRVGARVDRAALELLRGILIECRTCRHRRPSRMGDGASLAVTGVAVSRNEIRIRRPLRVGDRFSVAKTSIVARLDEPVVAESVSHPPRRG